MFCSQCGNTLTQGTAFCSGCGTAVAGIPVAVAASTAAQSPASGPQGLNFGQAITVCFSKYADFKGRALRSEYWWFYLFTVLLGWGATLVDPSGIVAGIVNLALLLPVLAAATRRLHDTGRSGWWQLIALTIIGLIPLIIWLASQGAAKENQYGPAPR